MLLCDKGIFTFAVPHRVPTLVLGESKKLPKTALPAQVKNHHMVSLARLLVRANLDWHS